VIPLGGFLPFSLNDYPGRPAAVIFTQGCNYRCPYCHNSQLIPHGTGMLEPETVFAHLRHRKDVLKAVVITGGEPTLHVGLADFCRRLKTLGLQIKLDTNGSRPDALTALLDEGLIDFFALDLKTTPEKYGLCGGEAEFGPVRESIRILGGSGLAGVFRTTMASEVTDNSDLTTIRELVYPGFPHVVQQRKQ
jgi:pyruvate formate lyase activating enzyme